MSTDPHADAVIHHAGAGPQAMILFHGRWGQVADILPLGPQLAPEGTAFYAPEAAGHSWWPCSFLAPMEELEPSLSSALACVERLYQRVRAADFTDGQIVLAGFSQGACLALEYAARSGRPYKAVCGFSGGLVGTDDLGPADPALYDHRDKCFNYSTSLAHVPVYLGCHAEDPHIPEKRVRASAARLRDMGADVTMNIHPGCHHMVTAQDIATARSILDSGQ